MDNRIAIVGAGLGGLTAALGLQRLGKKVRVFERAPELGEIGAGITMSPNASKILDALGLMASLKSAAHIVNTQGVLHFQTGKVLARNDRGSTPMEKYGAHYYQLHRADLHTLLVESVQKNDPDAVILNSEVTGLEQSDGSVCLQFASGDSHDCPAVIGADGIRSSVRAVLFGDEEPRFTGRVAWRGLVPAELVADWESPVESGMLIGPRKGIGFYPIRQGKILNYVAICRSDSWAAEGWNIHSTVEEVLAEFDGWYEPVRRLIAATPASECYKWGLFDRPPLDTWTQGRVTLLGDAAHPMLPYMGQGAAMAIEDGMVLARCISKYDDPALAFEKYEAARKDRATMVHRESAEKADRWEQQDAATYSQKKHRNEETIGLFEYDAMTVDI